MVSGLSSCGRAGLLCLAAASLIPSIFAQTVTYEAEDATLTGVNVATASTGFSGGWHS